MSRRRARPRPAIEQLTESTDAAGLEVRLDGPVAVPSGANLTHGLLVTNHSEGTVVLLTNGQVTARIVDPNTGAVVGGYAGGYFPIGRPFTVAPGATVRVPLLIGTASFDPTLGYVIPPGNWTLVTPISVTTGTDRRQRAPTRKLLTPALPIQVTPADGGR